MVMPGAEQMAHVAALFTSIDFWRLRPAPAVLAEQPGTGAAARFIAAAASDKRDLAVVYSPESQAIRLDAQRLPRGRASWVNPRTGERSPAAGQRSGTLVEFTPPGSEDWVLLFQARRP
jgi:hypothetical protein